MHAESSREERGRVVMLREGTHFLWLGRDVIEVDLDSAELCPPGTRLVLSDRLTHTYLVVSTETLPSTGRTRVQVREGRPITNRGYVEEYFSGARLDASRSADGSAGADGQLGRVTRTPLSDHLEVDQ